MDGAQAHRARPVPLRGQRRDLGGARRSGLAVLRGPLRRDVVELAYQFKVSRDGAETWSDASVLSLDEGDMVRGRPIVLSDGHYLLPIYHETGHDPEKVGPDSTSLFLRFDPAKKTWTKTGAIRSPNGNIQPAVAQLDDGRLIAYCRRGGDYDPKTVGYIVRSESPDGGRTWSEGRDSAFPNPNAAVDFSSCGAAGCC